MTFCKQRFRNFIMVIVDIIMLRRGILYGQPNSSPMDVSLLKNVKQLCKMIAELFLKNQEGKDDAEEEIAKMFIQ